MNVLITGGCGFIGCNVAKRLIESGHQVTVFDNLIRPLTEQNLKWLSASFKFEHVQKDLRDAAALDETLKGKFDAVIHLAAQVAVTTSVTNPRHDFEVNALGSFNLLEAVRTHSPEAIVLYASTNKVYGKLEDLKPLEEATRYHLPTLPLGVPETRALDFHSPYGCSKGAADQYVLDYARIYGLRTVALRQSCIYGPRQFGVEDQGWVAWFTIAHRLKRPITIYGNGKQVRDILFVDDLIDCYLCAIKNIDKASGEAFNIGGGPAHALSLLDLVGVLSELSGDPLTYGMSDWRPGDQPVYISDLRKANDLLGWAPKISVMDGLRRLDAWVRQNEALFTNFSGRL
jgi:CDP-paratose 2-epimerase